MQAISGNGCSYWLMPLVPAPHDSANTAGTGGKQQFELADQSIRWKTPHGMAGVDHIGKVGQGGEFAKQATTWPSPRSEDSEVIGNHPGQQDSLGAVGNHWPTPGANDQKGSAKEGQRRGQLDEAAEQLWTSPQAGKTERDEPLLPAQAAMWRTPDVPATGGPHSRKDSAGQGHQIVLDEQAALWTTPRASDPKTGHEYSDAMTGNSLSMDANSFSRPPQATGPAGNESLPSPPGLPQPSPERARLNPLFVTWLMGWPLSEQIGRTGFDCSATGSSLSKQPTGSSFAGWRCMMAEALRRLVGR